MTHSLSIKIFRPFLQLRALFLILPWTVLLGATPDLTPPVSADNTPLHRAALRGDADAVDALLASGADANATNQAGATPLHYGIRSERIVTALLSHGAKPDPVSGIGGTPLMGAVSCADSFGVARRLVEAGASIDARRAAKVGATAGASILSLAIGGGDQRTIAYLLEQHAQINPKQGFTPLAAAAFSGDIATTQRLIELGADLNAVSGIPGTALNTALMNSHPEVARLLIEAGADPRIKSPRGYGTPAMVLSSYNDASDPTIARLLTARGCDINTANETGETALSYALKRGTDTALVHFLRESGANAPDAPDRHKLIPNRELPIDSIARTLMVKEGAQRAVDLLQRSSTAFLQNKRVHDEVKCVSCHQQSLPAVAFGWARERGLQVDEHEIGRQLAAKLSQQTTQVERALELDQPIPDATIALGYDADGLNALHYAPDASTEAMSHYLLGIQKRNGSWPSFMRRVPIEDGPVVGTAWSIRAVQLYPPAGRASEVEDALRRARTWLLHQQPPTLNERTFQLFGLAWSNETEAHMRPFAEALIKEQQTDGGWAQLPGLASDAWATGSVLNALYKAGIATSHASYQRGLAFLLRTQFDDGSWWVRSRSWPFQPHFDGKFPHGKDQWISAAATAWATMALLLTVEPNIPPASLPNGQKLIANFKQSHENTAPPVRAPTATLAPTSDAIIDFSHDIQPLLERSCIGCHSGARPKGMFDLTSREGLLHGGQSGAPAVIPGYATESPLLQQVMGAIEDLEMPPLTRREKYPALTSEEINRLRTWIDIGAPWPAQSTDKTGTRATIQRLDGG